MLGDRFSYRAGVFNYLLRQKLLPSMYVNMC